MNIEWLVAGILFFVGIYALYYFLKTSIKSTVEKSIEHQFNIRLESFKQEFTRDLHSIDRKDKYRLAAIDKRLEAHQKAYALARKMGNSIHSDINAKFEFQKEFIEFWDSSCLYLEADVRYKLWVATKLFQDYDLYYQIWRDSKLKKDDEQKKNKEQLESVFNNITSIQENIASAVNLTAMADEASRIDNTKIVTAFGIEEIKKKLS